MYTCKHLEEPAVDAIAMESQIKVLEVHLQTPGGTPAKKRLTNSRNLLYYVHKLSYGSNETMEKLLNKVLEMMGVGREVVYKFDGEVAIELAAGQN